MATGVVQHTLSYANDGDVGIELGAELGDDAVPDVDPLPVNIAFSVCSFRRCRTRSTSSAPPVILSFLPETKPVSSDWNSSAARQLLLP